MTELSPYHQHPFIDARSYDGFRKVIADEFDYAYIIDLTATFEGFRDGCHRRGTPTSSGASAAVGNCHCI